MTILVTRVRARLISGTSSYWATRQLRPRGVDFWPPREALIGDRTRAGSCSSTRSLPALSVNLDLSFVWPSTNFYLSPLQLARTPNVRLGLEVRSG